MSQYDPALPWYISSEYVPNFFIVLDIPAPFLRLNVVVPIAAEPSPFICSRLTVVPADAGTLYGGKHIKCGIVDSPIEYSICIYDLGIP
jgi:hypothetical protein